MRLMIDTNIFLDVLGNRETFLDDSKAVLKLCEEKKVEGFVSASAITDLFYLSHRIFHDNEKTYKAIGNILKIVKVLTVTNEDVLEAFNRYASDFEDCLLATCAKNNKCCGIVTRNGKDFLSLGIKVYSPRELLEKYERNKVGSKIYYSG